MESTNPTIKVNFSGKRTLNYTIKIPRENGQTEIKGGAYIGEEIEIPISENNKKEND
jgi:hypothetical protein